MWNNTKVLIETYRGWEIYFDTDTEEFYTVSNKEDKEKTKRSYASTKKFIDDYIKDNCEFRPVKVMKMADSWNDDKTITLIGIRKDGAFMYEDEKGKKCQLSKWNEEKYFEINPENDEIFKELEELAKASKELLSKIKETEKKVIRFDVKQIRERFLEEGN